MTKRYLVTLSEEERTALQKRISSGKAAARLLTYARILLLADVNDGSGGRTDQQIGDALGVGICTIERVRQRFVEEGMEAALKPRPHPPRLCKLSGAVEARVLALTQSDPPRGHRRWTLRLLADKLVELQCLERVSHESIRQVLKKKRIKALAREDVMHSTPGGCRVCLPYGTTAGTLSCTV